MELRGARILVTGGARRVGRAIVEELAAAGARVAIHHAHSAEAASQLAASLPGALVVEGDLRDRATPRRVVDEAAARLGGLDAVVHNAAGYSRTPLATLDDDTWDDLQALNVGAAMRLLRAALPHGLVCAVNLVDVAAWQPWPNWSAYSVSKAALLHLTRCLAVELAPRVRVNAVAPGTVLWPEDWDDERRARQAARIPLGRAGTPEDVARAVRTLLVEDYLTGVCIPVDGGVGLR